MEKVKKIDIHMHTFPERGVSRWDGTTFLTIEEMRVFYDRIGVEKGVLLPMIAVAGHTDTVSMREARIMAQEHPETVGWWFCNLSPTMAENNPNADLSHYLNYYKEQGARGVGELTCNHYFDDPLVLNLFRHCERCRMPVLFHIGDLGNDYGLVDELGLPRLEKVLPMFPNLTFIGHSQKFWAEISGDCTAEVRGGYPTGKVLPGGRVVELMRKYPNLHADLSAGSGFNAISRDPDFGYQFLEEFQDRIYYGIDICSLPQMNAPLAGLSAWLDEAAETGKISYSAYKKISRENVLRLLGEV